MGQGAEDLEWLEQRQNSRWHHELNPRGYKTSEDFVWTTKDGTKIKLSDMTDSHIQNCVDILNGMSDLERAENGTTDTGTAETIKIMEHELTLRSKDNA